MCELRPHPNLNMGKWLHLVGGDAGSALAPRMLVLNSAPGHSVHKTRVISDDLDPTWDETCHFHNYNTPDPIKFVVWGSALMPDTASNPCSKSGGIYGQVRDKDFGGADDPLGNCTLPGSSFYEDLSAK
eukprot:3992384-Amphidinium_carterae.1